MLVRAARRKLCHEAIRNRISYESLQLPWLCPSYNAVQFDRRRWLSIDGTQQRIPIRKRRNSKDASSLPTRRSLATEIQYRPVDDIPFEGLRVGMDPPLSEASKYGNSYEDFGKISDMRPFDPSNAIYLDASLATAPKIYRARSSLGLGGDLSEIQSVFDACLSVGRIERAGLILRRLASIPEVDPASLITLHNRFLRASVENIIMSPSEHAMQEMHKWYELHIRLKDVPQTPETIAYMVKASLQSPATRRDRLVRRYMDMLDKDATYELLRAEVLTAYEINLVTQIYPKHKFPSGFTEDMELFDIDEIEKIPQAQSSSTHFDSTIPEVLETEQKGLGLKSVRKALSLFSHLPSEGIDLSTATAETKRGIQTRLEEDAIQSAVERWREENAHLIKMGMNTSLQTKSIGARMWKWHELLTDYIQKELVLVEASEAAEIKNARDVERCTYGPFLRLLPSEKMAAVVILTFMGLLSSTGADKGVLLANAITHIGNAVEDECACEAMTQNRKKGIWPNPKGTHKTVKSSDFLKKVRSRRTGSVAKYLANQYNEGGPAMQALANRQWPISTKAKVGACLMEGLIDVAKVPVSLEDPVTKEVLSQAQPAFAHSCQYKQGKKYGVIIANKTLVGHLKREPVHSLLAKQLPMIVPPENWTEFNKGGFLTYPGKMMRIKHGDRDQRFYAEAAIGQGDMTQTFRGLDILGKTAWQINQEVFDVMLEAWNSGKAVANLPPASPGLSIPSEPETSKDPLERRRWIKAVKLTENYRAGLHSQRCFQNFQLEIARALRTGVFYFPHNVDFRGRAYPIPPYLNHMGADHCRGLLKFGKGKELGEEGLRWLKIQLANVFGFDKASLSERAQFTDTNIAKIYDSAANPLGGKQWWLQAEDPWQCLAACFELRNALESQDPAKFVSYLPVHQDGTCNGLQHYAALGGDSWGAKQVNLEPSDRPADVYSAVADLVKESIKQDLAEGNDFARIVDGKITRKTVKQTVMTNVYGVTFAGAKAQVRKQLVAANENLPDNSIYNPTTLASYIATKIFKALGSMFRGAHDIQYWLGECASRISTSLTPEQLIRLHSEWPRLSSKNNKTRDAFKGWMPPEIEQLTQFRSSVIWTNPLHMPIVQPYRIVKAKRVETHMQAVVLSQPHSSDPVHKRKQLQGFPPNFIHSLDASHMLLSALKCDELGLSFAAVHDSFWTHACDVNTMSDVLRDSFVKIHTEDVIGRLAAEFVARYKGGMYLARVRAGTPLSRKLVAWRKEQLLTKDKSVKMPKSKKAPHLDELMLEYKRQKLLNSSNPAEIKQARKMITPGSLYDEMAAEGDLMPEEDLVDVGLGDISSAKASPDATQSLEETDSLESDMSEAEDAAEPLEAQEDISVLDTNIDEPVKSMGTFEKASRNLKAKTLAYRYVYLWLPLTFPPVPKKGDFDVSRLKESKYFFS